MNNQTGNKNFSQQLERHFMFKEGELNTLDWQLLQNGAVNLYKSETIFEDDIKGLKRLGYRVELILCDNIDVFKTDISRALDWESQFGYSPWNGNLDALNDGLRDHTLGGNGKLALACHKFHRLLKSDKRTAEIFLDILEYQSRNHLLFGSRLIGLIQTRDPHFNTNKLGGNPATWNNKEWFTKSRGI